MSSTAMYQRNSIELADNGSFKAYRPHSYALRNGLENDFTGWKVSNDFTGVQYVYRNYLI